MNQNYIMMPCGCNPDKHVYCTRGKILLQRAARALVEANQDPDNADLDLAYRDEHQQWIRHIGREEDKL